jgi:hypothetical protein
MQLMRHLVRPERPELWYIKSQFSYLPFFIKEAQMALEQRIESLRKRHADTDRILHEKRVHPASTDAELYQLKCLKLKLKDEITALTTGHAQAA